MLKKLEDEFPNHGSEYNRPIHEAKPIAAIKSIFNPKELENSPFETKSTRVPEYYNDNLGMTIEEEQNNRSNSYNDNQNKYNENGNKDLTNNADTGSDISNDGSFGSEGNVTDGLGGTEAGGETAIESASSTAISSSSVVSTASLTGGVTIISACAVVAVTVGGNIMNTPPKFENLMYEPGVQNLLIGGFIRFDGVEEKDEVIQTEETLERAQIEEILKNRDITTFAKFIPTAPSAAKDSVVTLAVELGITDRPFVSLIEKYCGVDIIQAISMKHQAEG